MKPKRLGRGLSGLISKTEEEVPSREQGRTPAAPPPPGPARGTQVPVTELPIADIRANPYQPRAEVDPASLAELQDSIREHGVLQPVVVRQALVGYELIAGERRLQAARGLGMERIPAVVRDATDEEMQTLALVENVQRVDLNALEKARALRSMMNNFSLTQAEVATRVGKARATISNLLRLLELPPEVQAFVAEGRLTEGHARAILMAKGTERRLELARLAMEGGGLSVRELERLAGAAAPKRRPRGPTKEDPYVLDLEDRLRKALSTKVRLARRGQGGTIHIDYHDADELDRLLEILGA